MSKEIKIVKVEPSNQPIAKGMLCSGSTGFLLRVVYTLEDGRKIFGNVERRRKKDIPSALESAQRAASAGAFLACFNDQGVYWGTCQKWHIGPVGSKMGLVPNPNPIDA